MTLMIVVLMVLMLSLMQTTLTFFWKMEYITLTPLESGFESLKTSSLLSLPFFFLTVLFVLFDMELLLLLPSILLTWVTEDHSVMWSGLLLLMMVTLILEWVSSGLKWNF
uniref:NADH-ubiquinone oxidoreductase chain 3 n=1 Tax=Paralongidorus litoralis TaxID=474435 RepID=A0A1P8C764_9BILA|nr:NADH dehydrogenase subunit 3 [Paralongidorus litoralis]AOT84244.1 NADH dehydrogenase subunit 3 [Paralongidorus litoralis]